MEAQVGQLNAQLQSQAFTKSARTQAAQFAATRKQAQLMQQTWADATASTGLFDVSSRKIRSHTDEWIKSVQKQRLSLRDLMGDMSSYKQAYHQQMRMQTMSVASFSTDRQGNPLASIAVPRTALASVDTLRQKLGYSAVVAESIGTQMINAGKNMQWAGRQLSMGFTAPLIAAGALSAKFALDIDKELTQVAKVYDTYATTQAGKEKELNKLRLDSLALAKQIAREYGMAASDTIAIMSQLASAGQRGKQLMSGTKETARFATLGDIDKDSAVGATRTLSTVFGIQKNELKQAVDFMNNIENATSLTMKDMAEAIPTASAAVKNLNGDYKDMLILLTAMRERGFDPGESANALKAAGTRLIRPSKRVQAEFQDLTGQSLMDIRDRNQGDLIKTLLDIGKATAGLETAQKQQARAAVFGTEQAARLGGAMDGLMQAQSGVGQTAKAMSIAQLSAADNAKVAEAEMNRQASSISGKWKRAVETIKVQLFDMGTAFVEAGTIVLTQASNLIDFFRNLPDIVKKGLIWTALIAAAAGPLLMFIGLTRNLWGQSIKLVAVLVKAATGFKLMTGEQMAASKAADWANGKLATEASTIDVLTRHIQAMTNAYNEANAARTGFHKGAMVYPAGTGPQGAGGRGSTAGTSAGSSYAGFDILNGEQAKKRQRSLMTANTAGMALFLSSMVASEVSSNHIVDNIAKWGMYAGLALPVFSMINKRLVTMGILSAGALGPWALAAAGIGAGLYAWHKHIQKANQAIDDMYNDSTKLAKIFNLDPNATPAPKATKNMDEAQKAQAKITADQAKSAALAAKLADAYPVVKQRIKEANLESEKFNIALAQGIKVLNMGGTKEQAEATIKGFLDAAQGTADANRIILKWGVDLEDPAVIANRMSETTTRLATELAAKLRTVREQNKDNSVLAAMGGEDIELSSEDQSKLKYLGESMGQILAANMMTEGKEGIKAFADQEATFRDAMKATTGNEKAREQLIRGLYKGYGVTGKAADLAIERLKEEHDHLEGNIGATEALEAAAIRLNLAWKANQTFGLENYTSADASKLQNVYDKAFMAGFGDDAQRSAQGMEAVNAALTEMNGGLPPLIAGFGNTADNADDLGININNAATEMHALEQAASGILSGAISDAMNQLGKDVYASMESGHTAALAALDKSMEAAGEAADRRADALEDRQKRQQDAFEDAQKRAQDALDARWAKRKKALQAEEDLRKRIFDAEKTRIQRMKELNNDNVDYRVAVNTGNLDEAAKIRNEISAKQETWALEDADAAASLKFDKAMAKLEAQEATEKKRLDRIQELQRRAFEYRQTLEKRTLDNQRAAAQKSIEIARNAENQRYALEKKRMDDALAYIKAQHPKNQAELNAAIAVAKEKFHIFGNDLEKSAKSWGNNMITALAKRTKEAYEEITKQDFGKSGAKIADDFMKGMSGGRITTGQIVEYMRTGKLPKAGLTPNEKLNAINAGRGAGGRHEGGPVGSIKITDGSRVGYPSGAAPYPSEKLILAKKDEYVVDGKTHRALGTSFLDGLSARHKGGPSALSTGPSALIREGTESVMKAGLKAGTQAYTGALMHQALQNIGIFGNGASMAGVDPKGWNKPWRGHYTTNNGHDYPLSYKPIYAPHSGYVRTHAITGYEPRAPHGGGGFRSYGQYVDFDGGGTNLMFAHLSKLPAKAGSRIPVKAGQYMGTTGMTGNASGPHVHVERNHSGNNSQFGAFFASRGVQLKTGGKIRYDNTAAILHKEEEVLTAKTSAALERGIDRLDRGDVGGYNGVGIGQIIVNGDVTRENIPRLAKEIRKEFDKDASRYHRKPTDK